MSSLNRGDHAVRRATVERGSLAADRYNMRDRSRVTIHLLLVSSLLLVPDTVWSQADGDPLPRGVEAFRLGADVDELEAHLAESSLVAWRGADDVSLSQVPDQPRYDVAGRGFVERAVFAFADGRVTTIELHVDARRVAFVDLYNHLVESYGLPRDLDPERAYWDDGETRLELARPLVVRYVDRAASDARAAARRASSTAEEIRREAFIDLF